MTTDKYTCNGELQEIIEKLENVRDSVAEILEQLEDVEIREQFYRGDAPYGLPLEDENGDEG